MKPRISSRAVAAVALGAALAGCVVQTPPQRVVVAAPIAYVPPPPPPVVSVYIDPPLVQPAPIAIGWAPPPMLVEVPPPSPIVGAVWIGGYWTWHGNWVWAAGRWAPPPRPDDVWVQPYYEHRDAVVLFIGGHWRAPGVVFVPPPPSLRLSLAIALPGVVAGPPPMGPPGIFLPPPPGSRPGLIVPAPLGTPPALMTGAPPIVNVGMRVQNTVNDTRITNVTNVTNLTVIAPATATQNGRAFEARLPAQAHLAAAMPPVVHAVAPPPQSTRPIPAFQAGQSPAPLPPPQPVRTAAAPPRPAEPTPPPPVAAHPPAASAPRVEPPGDVRRAAVERPVPAPAAAEAPRPPPPPVVKAPPPSQAVARAAARPASGSAMPARTAAKEDSRARPTAAPKKPHEPGREHRPDDAREAERR